MYELPGETNGQGVVTLITAIAVDGIEQVAGEVLQQAQTTHRAVGAQPKGARASLQMVVQQAQGAGGGALGGGVVAVEKTHAPAGDVLVAQQAG